MRHPCPQGLMMGPITFQLNRRHVQRLQIDGTFAEPVTERVVLSWVCRKILHWLCVQPLHATVRL